MECLLSLRWAPTSHPSKFMEYHGKTGRKDVRAREWGEMCNEKITFKQDIVFY